MPRQDPEPMPQADYDAIEAAVMETARGRWFLTEYARRHRSADTETILAAIDRAADTQTILAAIGRLETSLQRRERAESSAAAASQSPGPETAETLASPRTGGIRAATLAELEAAHLGANWQQRDATRSSGGANPLAEHPLAGTGPRTSAGQAGRPDAIRNERSAPSDLVDDPTLAMSRAEKIALFC